MILPDYNTAATKAAITLIKYGITSAPIDPLPILKKQPGVLVLSFAQMSEFVGMERRNLMDLCGEEMQDAVTSVHVSEGKLRYIVAFNQKLPVYLLQRALARELGHIVLGHDGSRPEKVREEEAICFAHHLLCPRALVHSVQAANLRLTVEVIGNLTGCYETCLSCMRRIPATDVPAELNRAVRDQFMDYAINFYEYQRSAAKKDMSAVADLGSFMDGYKE